MSEQNNSGSDRIVLNVDNLRIHYATPQGDVIAVSDISFKLYEGETLGLVGESGCGKSTTAYGILQLVQPPGYIVHGSIEVEGTEVLDLTEEELRKFRWTGLSLIPQGAMNSLNPTMRVKNQIIDVIESHEGKANYEPFKDRLIAFLRKIRRPSRKEPLRKYLGEWQRNLTLLLRYEPLKERIFDLFQQVGLPNRIYNMYPHELSGGMKQRVCIAMGVALHPTVVIADEATSALDVVVQRIVAQTLVEVKDEIGVSLIVIGHDMGLLAQIVDRIAVMYAGKMVEIAPVENVYANPLHPYTQLLIDSIPSIKERKPLKITEGITHDPRNPPSGCIFRLRCPFAWEHCALEEPPQIIVEEKHEVACHLFDEQFEERRSNAFAAIANS
ncbi:MAG: ABC transporter ATP-binding protein [Chloroflexi bacterium]|nr:ABC transporter ATP-binding protein [Chloroflexota bacterium]